MHTKLLKLLHLASPSLPVGAYSYSQGLEWAIDTGWVKDAQTAQEWIGEVLQYGLLMLEIPVLLRLHAAWLAEDVALAHHWNGYFLASRETAELRAETVQMGYSLTKLLQDWQQFDCAPLLTLRPPSFAAAYAFACAKWQIAPADMANSYAWSWLENQVMVTLKAVPLGQVAGQKILLALSAALEAAMPEALQRQDDELSNFLPLLAISSSRHEGQYSRLFRS